MSSFSSFVRRRLTRLIFLVILVLFAGVFSSCNSASKSTATKKVPVILDTDIGDDIDDMWSLVMILNSPQLDIKLITVGVGDTLTKAKVVAKTLEMAGRTDIPIGIGPKIGDRICYFQEWVKDYKFSDYEGTVYVDGVQALIDTIMNAKEKPKLIAIGPLVNISAALEREPAIAKKCDYIGMQGSIYKGYNNSPEISPEHNVRLYTKETRRVLSADWDIIITPLDTCGIIRLTGEKYKKILNSDKPMAKAIIQCYRYWMKTINLEQFPISDVEVQSTILYDTIAIYLASDTDFVKLERLGVRVDDEGYTRIDKSAKKMDCAVEWNDLDAFEDLIVERILR